MPLNIYSYEKFIGSSTSFTQEIKHNRFRRGFQTQGQLLSPFSRATAKPRLLDSSFWPWTSQWKIIFYQSWKCCLLPICFYWTPLMNSDDLKRCRVLEYVCLFSDAYRIDFISAIRMCSCVARAQARKTILFQILLSHYP